MKNIATQGNARLLGIEKMTGTLEVGKSAVFIVLDGDPLAELLVLEHPVHLVQRGILIGKPTYKKVKALEKHKVNRFFEKHINI